MNNKLGLITIGIYLSIALLIFTGSKLLKDEPVRASIYPRQITTSDFIVFSDSTKGADKILWEFGDGEKSDRKKGVYRFKKEGKYLVRLTVNQKKVETFQIDVVKPEISYKPDSSVILYGNASGIVKQKNHFKAIGNGIQWCEWYFGETGKIDARGQEVFWAFSKPGTYEIRLVTNLNPVKPKKHRIRIQDNFEVTEVVVPKPVEKKPAGGGGGGGGAAKVDELVTKLQAIARGENFNGNYKDVVGKYLCSNPHTPVVVNGKPVSDFYSYCQSLQLKSGTVIESATTELNPKSNCPAKLVIKHR
jgi:PKD repeat protein